MTITAHLVDPIDTRLKSYVLETTEFSGDHTTERIIDRLENVCIDWCILDKIVCLVSDTCNVMKNVGADFSKCQLIYRKTFNIQSRLQDGSVVRITSSICVLMMLSENSMKRKIYLEQFDILFPSCVIVI